MAEWFKASVLKIDGYLFISQVRILFLSLATVAQWVERPFCTWEVTGSSPVGCIIFRRWQYVTEWLTCPLWEREIEGSNPSVLRLILFGYFWRVVPLA